MSARILGIELRRSDAPWVAAFIMVVGGVVMVLSGLPHVWNALAIGQRETLGLFWPLALAAGAWQACRERRRRMEELIASTPRRRWQRVLPTATAMAVAAVAGHLGMFAAGAGYVGPGASYFPPGSVAIAAVGALSMVPAVWLGLAVGSRLPSALTPPVLGVAGVAALLLGPEIVIQSERYAGAPPGAILLLPSVGLARIGAADFATFGARVHLVQVLWFAALATAALAWLAAATRRGRLAAVLPAALGAAVALPLLPLDLSAASVLDRGAVAPVCTADAPRVCVTRVHAAALGDLRGPARQALAILASKLPDPPAAVAEDHGWSSQGGRPRRPDTVLVALRMTRNGRAADPPEELLWDLLAGAGTSPCVGVADAQREQFERYFRARLVAAAWLLGEPPPTDPGGNKHRPADAETVGAWETLRGLPGAEQRARVAALRQAALACDGRDLLDILVG